jgi:hypothetical protein
LAKAGQIFGLLQPVQKKRQEDVKFTFNVGKCDKIFDKLLKMAIKINHIVPSADELKASRVLQVAQLFFSCH